MININELLEKKKQKVLSEEEKHKIDVIEKLIKEPNWEYRLGFKTVTGILRFLDVSEKDIKAYHIDVLSNKKFTSNTAKVYTLIDPDEISLVNK